VTVAHSNSIAPGEITPSERLLLDSLDAALRDRETLAGSEGLGARGVARRLAGVAHGSHSRTRPGALTSIGYAPWAEPMGCWTFVPSASRDQCETDCLSEMAESGSGACDGYLDCGSDGVTRRPDASKMDAMAVEVSGTESLGFVRGPLITRATDAERGLIYAAWNLILDNMDLVAWTVCKVAGSVSTTEFGRLLDRINGKRPRRVAVRVMDVKGTALAAYGTDYILIAGKGAMWTQFKDLWASSDPDTRLCALIATAAMLLHELTHLAGYTYIDLEGADGEHVDWGYEGGTCYTSIMIGSTFSWGLHQRYPEASDAPCCSELADAWSFGCGRSPVIENGCSGGSATGGSYVGGGGGVGALFFDFLRWVVGAAIGAIRRGISELAELVADVVGPVLGEIAELVADVVRHIGEWWESMSAGEGSGGGCGCSCEPCYSHCPELYVERGSACVLKVDLDHPAFMRCMAECGLGEVPDGPASFESAGGA
jgi:hypothetical protein